MGRSLRSADELAIDAIVGRNVRTIRLSRRMSQSGLAEAVGITFQQIQKYESGDNRISASRMVLIARALDVPLLDLFAGIEDIGAAKENVFAAFGELPLEIATDIAGLDPNLVQPLARLIRVLPKAQRDKIPFSRGAKR